MLGGVRCGCHEGDGGHHRGVFVRSGPHSVPLAVRVACDHGPRARLLTWGATGAEAAARLPGDELLEDPAGYGRDARISHRATVRSAPAQTAAVRPERQ